MYDYLYRMGAPTLIVFAFLCAITSAAEFNGTSYHLGERNVMVVVPVNSSKLNITISEKTENITLLDRNGKNINITSSYRFWRGDHIYSINFAEHVAGKLIYTLPLQGQQFILPIKDEVPVRIILPQGYTTGDRTLGIANPSPDEFLANDTGNILTWYNTSQISYIEVSYYRKNAPQALMTIFIILALAGAVLLIRYYISVKRLKEMSDEKI